MCCQNVLNFFFTVGEVANEHILEFRQSLISLEFYLFQKKSSLNDKEEFLCVNKILYDTIRKLHLLKRVQKVKLFFQ